MALAVVGVFILSSNTLLAKPKTFLTTGDVAFTGFNFDSPNDSFSIIFLTNATAGEQILFTDHPYSDLTGFLTSIVIDEGTFLWEVPGSGIPFGTQVTYWRSGTTAMASQGTVVAGNGLNLSSNGDQIFAVRASLLGTVLAGVHSNNTGSTSASDWDGRGALSNANQSDLPNVLTNGVNALYFGSETDNARYNCIYTMSTAAQIRAAVNDTNNWTKNDGSAFSPTACVPSETIWDGANWSNGEPTSSLDIVIASSTATGTISGNNVTINSGNNLTINSSDVVTVNGDLTNSGNGATGSGTLRFTKAGTASITGNAFSYGGKVEVASGTTLNTNDKLTLQNGCCLMHGTGTPGGGGSVTGNITIEKTIGSTDGGWRLFSMPIESTIDNFENGINTLCANFTPAGARNVYYWDADIREGSADSVAVGWVQAPATDDENKAYSIYIANTSSNTWAFDSTVSISGVPNNGTKNHSLVYSFDPGGDSSTASQKGWNLIPNPYPSNLDITDLIQSSGFGPNYKAVHIWDQSVKQMRAINSSGFTNYNTDGGSIYGTYAHIPPFMAFWVKADANGQTVDVTNAMRVCGGDSVVPDNYMKNGQDVVRIQVKDYENNLDQFSVALDPMATTGVDLALDLYKFKSSSAAVPTLYTTVADGSLLSLNTIPFDDNHNMPLYMESYTDGKEYTFSSITSDYSHFYNIELEDRKTGTVIDIITDEYKFIYDINYIGNRFVLKFTRRSGVGVNDVNTHPEIAYVHANSKGLNVVYKNLSPQNPSKIEIYNMAGQKLYEATTENANGVKVFKPTGNTTQIYIVNIIGSAMVKTIKAVY